MVPSQSKTISTVFWFWLLGLPLEHYDEANLFKIVKKLGRPIKDDILSDDCQREILLYI